MRAKLGQHFLTDRVKLRSIAAALAPTKGEVVIEIGPGHGELTRELVGFGARVIAIEKDVLLAEKLSNPRKGVENNVEVVVGDALRVLPQLVSRYGLGKAQLYLLAGNIPYSITGRLLRTLAELSEKPVRTVLTIQREVAERAVSEPPRMNLLAATIQVWAACHIVGYIPSSAFMPPPKVGSAIILLETRLKEPPANYYVLTRALFRQPRKTILNNLVAGSEMLGFPNRPTAEKWLQKLKIDPSARAQELSVDTLTRLAEALPSSRSRLK